MRRPDDEPGVGAPPIRDTFLPEAIRAVASGTIETALATFAVLIAVTQFESSAALKSFLLACPAVGLLGSLWVVPLVKRWSLTASRAAAIISVISAVGFAIAALGAQNEIGFVIGMSIGIGVIGMAIPLQTYYLRLNYPGKSRGRLFSITLFIRALTSMVVSWGFGVYLDQDLERYPVLLWTFMGAALLSALCHSFVPSEKINPLDRELEDAGQKPRSGLLESVHVSGKDRVFVRLLIAAMVMGLGVLSANALRVDYLVNPVHGLEWDVKTVSFITGVVPSVMRLVSTFFWGWLFDHMNFFRLRIIVNVVFLAGILLYFLGSSVLMILFGSALFGLARGGGEIMFNLFVTKLAPAKYIADYMSVHTFLAGIRLSIAPFLGFFLVVWVNIPVMVAVSVSLVLLSIFVVRSASKAEVNERPKPPQDYR